MLLWEHQGDCSIFASFKGISWNLSAILSWCFIFQEAYSSDIDYSKGVSIQRCQQPGGLQLSDFLQKPPWGPWGLQIASCSFLSLYFYPVLTLEGTMIRKLIINSTESQCFQLRRAVWEPRLNFLPWEMILRRVPFQDVSRTPQCCCCCCWDIPTHTLSLHRELLGFLNMLQMLSKVTWIP